MNIYYTTSSLLLVTILYFNFKWEFINLILSFYY